MGDFYFLLDDFSIFLKFSKIYKSSRQYANKMALNLCNF